MSWKPTAMVEALGVTSMIVLAGSLAPIWMAYDLGARLGIGHRASAWEALQRLPSNVAQLDSWQEAVLLHAQNIILASILWLVAVVAGRWSYRTFRSGVRGESRPLRPRLASIDDRFFRRRGSPAL